MRRDRYPPDLALYQRYVRLHWRQYRLKWASWLVLGVYVLALTAWSILEPYDFQEVEGLALLPGIPIGLWVILTTVKEDK